MDFPLIHFLTFLSVAVVASHAAISSEVYWKSKLPNTPIPKAIVDILHSTEWANKNITSVSAQKGVLKPNDRDQPYFYNIAATETQLKNNPNAALYFLKEDITPGTKMNLRFTKSPSAATFLPRQVADAIPFSSKKIPEILERFSVKPNSVEAKIIRKTISECEETGIVGEEKYCVTSLESMVDFSTSKLGKKVEAISTVVNKEETKLQKYSILASKKLLGDKAVVCHKQNYAYAVFYCHKAVSTEAYKVSLVGADGTKAKAVAVCHMDSAGWNPKHLAFQTLKVKPGTVPICHFLPEDHVVWVPY